MAVDFSFSFLYRSASLSLLLHFGSTSLYRSVLFLCFSHSSLFQVVADLWVSPLMVFVPIGRFGGGRGRNAGGRSVQRRAGG